MRGKDTNQLGTIEQRRITPTYAGKRAYDIFLLLVVKDHPRVCGEKTMQSRLRALLVGSPPRMRGKGAKPVVSGGAYRITPAYAGKSTHILYFLTEL